MRALHLLALYALAVAQPLLGLLGDNADFFISRGADGAVVVAFALLLALVPPMVVAGLVEAAGRLHAAAGRALQLVAVGALVAALAVQLLKQPGHWGTAPMLG